MSCKFNNRLNRINGVYDKYAYLYMYIHIIIYIFKLYIFRGKYISHFGYDLFSLMFLWWAPVCVVCIHSMPMSSCVEIGSWCLTLYSAAFCIPILKQCLSLNLDFVILVKLGRQEAWGIHLSPNTQSSIYIYAPPSLDHWWVKWFCCNTLATDPYL